MSKRIVTVIIHSKNEMLQHFHMVSQALQNEHVYLKLTTCVSKRIVTVIIHSKNDMLQHFHMVSQAPQNEHVYLKSCADLFSSFADYLLADRNEFKRFDEAAKGIIPSEDHKATLILKRNNTERGS